MNLQLLRGLTAVPGIPMLLNGIGFVVDPAQAAASLGMPLLDGIGRSTQLGDFGGFFLSVAGFIFYGAYAVRLTWLRAAAILLGAAALLRVVAWLVHGADFAGPIIVIEVLLATWLLVCAGQLGRHEKVGHHEH